MKFMKTRLCIVTFVIYAISPFHFLWSWVKHRLTIGPMPFVEGLAMYYAGIGCVVSLMKEVVIEYGN